jgi:curli biogenesis system outer membrane secretion channel CsgG
MNRPHSLQALALVAAVTVLASLTGCAAGSQPMAVNDSASHRALVKLPRKQADARVAVAIYEVGSNLPELPARGATEQFKTALVKSGQFRVLERGNLERGVIREKQLNGNGQSSGSSAQSQLAGAEYLFQAEITELAAGTSDSSSGINIGGLQIGGGANRDELGLDVSIVDAHSGEVMDAVNVRVALGGSAVQVGGLGALVNTVLLQNGRTPSAYTPEVQHQSSRKANFDAALRSAIEDAVRQLATRFDSQIAQAR